jgi:hypothetical protein
MIKTFLDESPCPANNYGPHRYDKDGFCDLCNDIVSVDTPETFQERVHYWLEAAFGVEASKDKMERVHRFIEEGLELAQSLGCTQHDAHQLVDYVFSRPIGEPLQELGGTMTTIAALSAIFDFNMAEAGEHELERMWQLIDRIRAKQKAKPKYSPLPGQLDKS